MSFFSKKKVKLKEEDEGDLPLIFLEPSLGEGCPPVFRESGICVCMSCSRLGGCRIEKVSKSLRCARPIRACSVRSQDKGIPPACADLILEEFFDYINGKYLR
jgi:hypothetical protein